MKRSRHTPSGRGYYQDALFIDTLSPLHGGLNVPRVKGFSGAINEICGVVLTVASAAATIELTISGQFRLSGE
jgi:hypothetical protein